MCLSLLYICQARAVNGVIQNKRKAALPLHLKILATAVRQEKYVKAIMMKRVSVVSPENVHTSNTILTEWIVFSNVCVYTHICM